MEDSRKEKWIDWWWHRWARGVILAYLRGIKPRAILENCVKALTGARGLSRERVYAIIGEIERDPHIMADPERVRRLAKLKEALAKADWRKKEPEGSRARLERKWHVRQQTDSK